MLPSEVLSEDDPSLQRPDAEEIAETTEKTRLALEKLSSTKIAAAMPVRCADKAVSQASIYESIVRLIKTEL